MEAERERVGRHYLRRWCDVGPGAGRDGEPPGPGDPLKDGGGLTGQKLGSTLLKRLGKRK